MVGRVGIEVGVSGVKSGRVCYVTVGTFARLLISAERT